MLERVESAEALRDIADNLKKLSDTQIALTVYGVEKIHDLMNIRKGLHDAVERGIQDDLDLEQLQALDEEAKEFDMRHPTIKMFCQITG